MPNFNSIGQYFRQIRKEKGFTQEQLAKEAGLSRTYLVALEGGHVVHPQIQTRSKIHASLGTSDSELEDLRLIHIDGYGNESIPDQVIERTSMTKTGKLNIGQFQFVGSASPSEALNADHKRRELAQRLELFTLTQERFDALATILFAFTAEDHAGDPNDWAALDDVPF